MNDHDLVLVAVGVLVIAVLVAVLLVVLVIGAAALWLTARGAQAWTVAVGQAQQLALVGLNVRENVRSRTAEDEPERDEPTRPARASLLDDYDDDDLRDAARRSPPQRRPREYNANENGNPNYIDPETAFENGAVKVS